MYNENIILTPQDILEKEFKIDATGYRAQEVDGFLDTIIKDYTEYNKMINKLVKENKSLTDEISELKSEIRKLKEMQSVNSDEDGSSNKQVNNLDLLRRISQLEKIVYGEKEK